MKPVLERVRGLLELAVSSASEHEARNAALQACRLMRKHGLLVVEPTETAEAPAPEARKSRPQRPSARVRVPMRAIAGLETVGRAVQDVAMEAASRVTVADVVDVVGVFVKRRR